MLYDALKNFSKQFSYEPRIEQGERLDTFEKFVVCGMGGSALGALLVKRIVPEIELVVHRDYGLPESNDLPSRLIILNSYSGNTEEVLGAYEEAKKHSFRMLVISIGGELLKRAQKDGIPHIQMPDWRLQPRVAIALNLVALLKAMGQENAIAEAKQFAHNFDPAKLEDEGRVIADSMQNKLPLIYASTKNFVLAYIWKITLNETGKTPAFCNIFPELNHNEIEGFSSQYGSNEMLGKFSFIVLKDPGDHPKIQKRMGVLEKILRERGFFVNVIALSEKSDLEKIFSSIVLAEWAGYHLAKLSNTDPDATPLIDEFKKMIA